MSIPAMKTARKPEPRATVATPKMHRTLTSTRGAYSPSLGSGTRRMNASRAMPPATPTAVPTAICKANSVTTCQATPAAEPCAASSAASSAIPTGSLAPDSPSSSTPVRPATSRRPNTEKTTAGSVAATAVPSSRASRQSIPATKCAAVAAPADVHAAVEQDDRQRHGDHAFHCRNRQQCRVRPQLRRDARADQEERRRRDAQPRAQPVGKHGGDSDQADHQHDKAELVGPRHRAILTGTRLVSVTAPANLGRLLADLARLR